MRKEREGTNEGCISNAIVSVAPAAGAALGALGVRLDHIAQQRRKGPEV